MLHGNARKFLRQHGSRLHPLRAAAHSVGHFVAGNAVPIAEFLKLFEVKLFRHFPQRVVSSLRVTEPTQDVNQPSPRIRHLSPQAPFRVPTADSSRTRQPAPPTTLASASSWCRPALPGGHSSRLLQWTPSRSPCQAHLTRRSADTLAKYLNSVSQPPPPGEPKLKLPRGGSVQRWRPSIVERSHPEVRLADGPRWTRISHLI